jgi:RHS repeat-associated protein
MPTQFDSSASYSRYSNFRAAHSLFKPSLWQRVVSIALIIVMALNPVVAQPAVTLSVSQTVSETYTGIYQNLRFRWYANGYAGAFAAAILIFQGNLNDRPKQPKPEPQEKQSDRDAKVAGIRIHPSGVVNLSTGEPAVFNATAYDANGVTVTGVKINWDAEAITVGKKKYKGKFAISPRGEFISPEAGEFIITGRKGNHRSQVRVIVTGEVVPPLQKLIEKYKPFDYGTVSTRDLPQEQQRIGRSTIRRQNGQGLVRIGSTKSSERGVGAAKPGATRYAPAGTAVTAMPFFQSGDIYGWNNSNYMTADDSGKERGDMPGRPADGGAGSSNFQFAAPVLGLEGRGIDLSLALTYNSRVWHKANSEITFDIDRDWPAPGWSLGFGKIISMGTDKGFMMIDGDGTRHGYVGNGLPPTGWQYFSAHTADGSFIDYTVTAYSGTPQSGTARLPNGTVITYGAPGANAIYPTNITDAQGNYITITYRNNQGPQIQTVSDTLNREIKFYYDANNNLVAITAPGLTTGTTRTLVRITYDTLTLNYNFGLTTRVRPGQFYKIKAIYYPATSTGYWFGEDDSYSPYGMIRRVLEERGMSFSGQALPSDPALTADAGTITRGTNMNSVEMIYNYPTSPDYLTAEPTYTEMKEKWAGMDTSAPYLATGYAVTAFSVVEETAQARRKTTITRPDGTRHVQYAYILPGSFQDGLVFYDKVCKQGEACEYSDMGTRASSVTWEMGAYDSPRPSATHAYDLPQSPLTTKLTTFTYGSYNQVTRTEEWDYEGQKRRVTLTTYENSAAYTNRHIFNLVKSVEVQDGGGVVCSRTEYDYDTAMLMDAPNVTHHSLVYDPYDQGYESCNWVWDEQLQEYVYVCNWVYTYDSATDKRGNVTSIKRYTKAGTFITETRTYDKTGNMRTASPSCCEQVKITYTDSTQFAYPEEQISGSATDVSKQNKTTATFYVNVGLVNNATDANNRTSITQYYSETLRPQYVWSPTGAYTHHVYDDTNLVVYDRIYFNDDLLPGIPFTMASGSDKYLDGQGRTHGEIAYGAGLVLDVVNTKFDGVGRVWKQTRPYRSGETQEWFTYEYDSLDRVTRTIAPDLNETRNFYDNDAPAPNGASTLKGNTTLARDQWGRERWGRTDYDGKLVEVMEPKPDGTSAMEASGNLQTTYSYSVIGNLTQVNQGAQTRTFKYDWLGRLTNQKLAETEATLDDNGAAGSTWSDYFKYDDRSNLIERIDARRVKIIFDYQNDPLSRLKEIRYDKTNAIDASLIEQAPKVTYDYETGTNLDKTRLKKITVDGFLVDDLFYDLEGRLNQITRTFNARPSYPLQTNYLYDKADRLRETQYPAEHGEGGARKIVRAEYDEASRVKELKFNNQSFASQLVYNASSQTTSLNIGYHATQQLSETYTYSAQTGLMTNQTVQRVGSSTPLLNLSYEYTRPGQSGVSGQLTKIINNLDANKNKVYEYDALARLKLVKSGSNPSTPLWTQAYTYDRYGNRTNVTKTGSVAVDGIPDGGNPATSTMSFNSASNRITNTNYEYDKAGNLMRGQAPDGTFQRYRYDTANRLVKILADDGTTEKASYSYGADNARLKQSENAGAVVKWFAWDGGAIVAEYEDTSSALKWKKSYVYLGGRLLATQTPTVSAPVTQYHHPDRLGTRLVTDAATSQSAGEQENLPFGTALDSGVAGNTRRFTSYDRSDVTKLDYAVNRFYNAGQGRFTQVDPIEMQAVSPEDPQTLNLYTYCGNDPINYVDPDGLFFKRLWRAIKKFFSNIWVQIAVMVALTIISIGAASGKWALWLTHTDKSLSFSIGGGIQAGVATGAAAGTLPTITALGWATAGLSAISGIGLPNLGAGWGFRTPPINGGAIEQHFQRGSGGRGRGGGGRGGNEPPPRARHTAWARIIRGIRSPRPPRPINIPNGRLVFRGMIKSRPLRELTHNEIYNAFSGTGYTPTSHFIMRLKDARTEALGIRTLNDFARHFNLGEAQFSYMGRISISHGRFETIVEVTTTQRVLVTLTPK